MKLAEERAVIVAVDADGGAWVQADSEAGCNGCAASGACGTALLGQALSRTARRLRVDNPAGMPVGTPVILGIAPGALMLGAIVTYLLPLAGLLAGGVLGSALATGEDLPTLMGGAAGMFLCYLLARRLLRRKAHALSPRLLRKAASGNTE